MFGVFDLWRKQNRSTSKRKYHFLTRDVQYERYRKHMEVSVEGINLFAHDSNRSCGGLILLKVQLRI